MKKTILIMTGLCIVLVTVFGFASAGTGPALSWNSNRIGNPGTPSDALHAQGAFNRETQGSLSPDTMNTSLTSGGRFPEYHFRKVATVTPTPEENPLPFQKPSWNPALRDTCWESIKKSTGGRPTTMTPITFTGTATYLDLEGGFWGIVADDGTQYLPVSLPKEVVLSEGQRLTVTAFPVRCATIQNWGTPIRVTAIDLPAPKVQSFTGTSWVLDSIREQQSLVSVPEGITVTLSFTDTGTFGGRAPVNQYGGEYTATAHDLELSRIFTTLMAGSPELMDLETLYYSHLASVRSFEVGDQVLTLSDRDGSAILKYHAESVVP